MLHALAVLVSLALPCPQDSKAPAAKELEELARTYLSQDARTPKGRLEQFRALRRIDQGPPLSASEVKSWTAKLLKIGASGAKLEKKSGRHFFWTKPEDRGLFILGGRAGTRPDRAVAARRRAGRTNSASRRSTPAG
jgi:hypothetical protein